MPFTGQVKPIKLQIWTPLHLMLLDHVVLPSLHVIALHVQCFMLCLSLMSCKATRPMLANLTVPKVTCIHTRAAPEHVLVSTYNSHLDDILI